MPAASSTFSFVLISLCVLPYIVCNIQPPVLTPSLSPPSKYIGDCQACKVLVQSFNKGLERTARGKFEGGDAAWEEEKLRSYRHSEVRLVELQEGLCKDTKSNEARCHALAEKAEEYIEDWWFKLQDSEDLFDFLCIKKLKYCCPPLHYGKDCEPCRTDPQLPCSGNGKCKGDGTRKGNGLCACNDGYTAENCSECAKGYYAAYKDENKVLCARCHKACVGECTVGGPKGCVVCAPGWSMDTEEGCVDVNECEDVNKCGKNKFCVNEEGTYRCLVCDKSCNGCYGDGPDLCHRCNKGYSKKGELCIADREDEDNTDHLTYTRYLSYVGLLIATAILLPKSTTLGTMVGAVVMSYIIGAEYYCMINGHSHGLIDLKKFDLSQLFRS